MLGFFLSLKSLLDNPFAGWGMGGHPQAQVGLTCASKGEQLALGLPKLRTAAPSP